MKKSLSLSVLTLISVLSCSCDKKIQTTGVVDCDEISVSSGGSSVFSKSYSASYSKVYEYKSENGDSIYTDLQIIGYYNSPDYKVVTDIPIYLYNSRYKKSDYVKYSYVGFIGWLTVEYNYYLHLDEKIIDSEIKWSEYLYDKNPDEEPADNKKAYECAKKGYYHVNGSIYYNPEKDNYYPLSGDLTDKSLERHSYTKLGDDSVITYTAKWY